MDEAEAKMKSFDHQPKTIAELLLGIDSILSNNSTHKQQKAPRSTTALTLTSEKAIKPLTIAEMRNQLKGESSKRCQPKNSVKKNWNSSVKVDKTKNHTANRQLKYDSVGKNLNFTPKPITSVRATIINPETPKFPKLELEAKTSLNLNGILSNNSSHALTARKVPRSTTALTLTSERAIQPLTIAEMRNQFKALQGESSKRCQQENLVQKNWSSSVKLDKTKSHTANGQLKPNLVKKSVNFQPKPKTSVRATVINPETPKFPKPELKTKTFLNLHAKNNVRISGVHKIPETPVIKSNSSYKSRMTLSTKENVSNQSNNFSKLRTTPKPRVLVKVFTVPDTPLNNMSWKLSDDASFLQAEKEIEQNSKALQENQVLENICQTTQLVSTPVKEYTNVQDFFNNTNDTGNPSLCNDNTIKKCFNKLKISKEKSKMDESVLVSLCNMLNKVIVNNCEKDSTEYEDLIHVQKQIEMIDNCFKILMVMKESHLKYARKLINEKYSMALKVEHEDIVQPNENEEKKERMGIETNIVPNSNAACSVIKSCSKLPSYKIPKKNLCLRKKVFHKSMPNVSNAIQTPVKDTSNKALSMYMEMKGQMNFLNTPLIKCNRTETPNTPAVTSQNLQMQLDKLYNSS